MRYLPRLLLSCLAVLSVPLLHAQNFVGPQQIPISAFPMSLAIGDLNGDGLPDIVWGEYYGSGSALLHVLLAKPGGGYTSIPSTASLPIDPVCRIADTNADGKPDLVCIGNPGPVVFLGNGDGTFATPGPASIRLTVNTISAPLDLNRDGFPDFVVTDSSNAYVLLGNGKAGFTLSYTLTAAPLLPAAVMDINHDGIPDLLFSGPAVALGLGNGKFGSLTSYPAPAPAGLYDSVNSCVFADIDRDGAPDAICARDILQDYVDSTGVSQLIAQHGNPDGTFSTQPFLTQTYGDTTNDYNGYPTLNGLFAALDVNGDGRPDILESSYDGLGVLLGQSATSFAYPLHYGAGTLRPNLASPIVLADMNGDGRPDLVSAGYRSILISYGNPDGSFATVPDLEVAKFIQESAVADFNGDGIPDVLTAGDVALELSLGNGDGSFQPYKPVTSPPQSFVYKQVNEPPLYHGDFNGDGKQDVIANGDNGQGGRSSYLFFGNGDGSFGRPIQINGTLPDDPGQIADLDGDGRDDIFTTNSSFTDSGLQPPLLLSLLFNADGSFRVAQTPVPPEKAGDYYLNTCPPRLADFNHDAKLDAAVASKNFLYILAGHGDGTFDSSGTAIPIPAVSGYTVADVASLAIGDFDGDGLPDVAVAADLMATNSISTVPSQTAIFVFSGAGGLNFTPGVLAQVFPIPGMALQAADFRNEGHPELLLNPFSASGTFYLLHSSTNRTFDSPQTLVSNNFSSSIAIADLNHDGLLDLLVTNGGANTVDPILNLGLIPQVTGTLTAAPEPSLLGQAFSVTATLAPPATQTVPLTGSITFAVDGIPAGTVPLAADAATITIPGTLSIGAHTLTAVWPGDTTYPAVNLSHTHVVQGLPSSLTLTSSLNPSLYNQTVTFTATLSVSTAVPPTGSITFTDANGLLQTVQLTTSPSGQAKASFPIRNLAVGTHPILATYLGDTTYSPSTASLTQQVNAIPVTSTLTAAPNPALVYQPVQLTFTLSGLDPGIQPSGRVTFTDGTSPLGTASIPPSGVLVYPVTFTLAGSHTLTASYTADNAYTPTSASAVELVDTLPVTVSLSSSLNPALRLQPVTFTVALSATQPAPYSGTVTLTDGSATLATLTVTPAGTASYTSSTLAAGTHSIIASYSGTPQALQPGTSAPLLQVIQRAPSTLALTVTPSPGYQGQPIALAASLATSGTATPIGSITFYDGATPLGTVPLTSTHATFTTSQLAPGTHLLSAAFTGDDNTLPATSLTVSELILASDFTLSSTPTTLSIKTGHHLTFTLGALSIGAFADKLQLSAINLPPHVTLRPAASSLTLTPGANPSVSIYLDTDDVIGYLSRNEAPASGNTTRLLCAATLFFAFLRNPRRRLRLSRALTLVAAAALLSSAIACSGKYPASTPPGTYSLRITATGQTTQTTHTLAIPLVVTQ